MIDLSEIILPRRAVPQPSPGLSAGGDCGACVIAGVLGISVAEAYELQDKDERPVNAKDQPYPFSWQGMGHALKCWGRDALTDGVITETPLWPWEAWHNNMPWGLVGWQQNMAWWNYVRMGLLGGFYGIIQMDIDGRGPMFDHNHWQLICGARLNFVPHPTMDGCGRYDQDILVSCSARHPEGKWYDSRTFLRERGGFNVIMVRPKAVRQ